MTQFRKRKEDGETQSYQDAYILFIIMIEKNAKLIIK